MLFTIRNNGLYESVSYHPLSEVNWRAVNVVQVKTYLDIF